MPCHRAYFDMHSVAKLSSVFAPVTHLWLSPTPPTESMHINDLVLVDGICPRENICTYKHTVLSRRETKQAAGAPCRAGGVRPGTLGRAGDSARRTLRSDTILLGRHHENTHDVRLRRAHTQCASAHTAHAEQHSRATLGERARPAARDQRSPRGASDQTRSLTRYCRINIDR